MLEKKIEGPLGEKFTWKSRNSCRSGEVGAEGMVTKSAMVRSPETKYTRSKFIFSVATITLTVAPLCTKLLEISAQFLIGSPGTLLPFLRKKGKQKKIWVPRPKKKPIPGRMAQTKRLGLARATPWADFAVIGDQL